ncbi:hypothetical protein SLEP1_g17309 [Rubroshorea leprosula]|uniref:Uncharacterized protein n=1 Tax=Rubroshorea leprosula TaxID=152421 RepID=A0AAV5IZP2_9ROSI|nr:hypothetical protein SLEP1_g17309 [Rubroshorea leprosula]
MLWNSSQKPPKLPATIFSRKPVESLKFLLLLLLNNKHRTQKSFPPICRIPDLLCSVLTVRLLLLCGGELLWFLIFVSFPADPTGLFPKLQLRFPCLQILEAKSRTGKPREVTS